VDATLAVVFVALFWSAIPSKLTAGFDSITDLEVGAGRFKAR
jgi:hypothetical protein